MKIFLVMAVVAVFLTAFSVIMGILFVGVNEYGLWNHSINAASFLTLGILTAIFASGRLAGLLHRLEEHCPETGNFSGIAANTPEERKQSIANMRSDMRKPLNSVIRLSEHILGKECIHEEARDSMEKIHNAGMTLLGIINDTINIPAAESQKFDLIPIEYDVPSLINDIVALNAVRSRDRPIKFSLHINGTLPRKLFGDELRVELICNNLLDNAFKYTKEGSVDLFFECEREGNDEWLTIRVADTGIGIRPENIDTVFSGYASVGYGKSGNKIDGTGLCVTKTIAEMMGGTITVSSEYMKGSVFTVRVRQGFVTALPVMENVVESLKRFHYSGNNAPDDKKIARIQLPHVKVLVVDDVQANLDIAKELLEAYGMQVDCLNSGRRAIQSIYDERVIYDAIFMDHMMPDMDGIETARIIREGIGTRYARNVPIIALTANTLDETEKMFLGKRFQAFISKPIDVAQLDETVTRFLACKELQNTGAGACDERDSKEDTIELIKSLTNKISPESTLQSQSA
jgi:signal transduction histidine kinase/DNA-binding NarL/FixJ family response regulator